MKHSIHLASLLLVVPLAIGCKASASVGTNTTPPPAPAPAPVVEAPAPAPTEEPETEPVVKVEPKHIDIQKNVIRLKRGIKIKFGTNSATLEKASNEILDEVASVMTQNEKIRVRVEGHTDNTGVADKNLALSDSRAAAVKDYIIAKGIAADRLESKGCGQAVPVADNATEDGKAENRRVEFVILRRRIKEPCQLYKPGEGRKSRKEGETTPAPTP